MNISMDFFLLFFNENRNMDNQAFLLKEYKTAGHTFDDDIVQEID